MKRFIRKISVLIISLFICLNIIVPFNVYGNDDLGVLAFFHLDNQDEPFSTYTVTDNDGSIVISNSGESIEGLNVGYNSQLASVVINVTEDVTLSNISLYCEGSLTINLDHNFTINTSVNNMMPRPAKSFSSNNLTAVRRNLGKVNVIGALNIFGDHKFEINASLDQSFEISDNPQNPSFGIGMIVSAGMINIGNNNIEKRPTVVVNEIRNDSQKNSYSLFGINPFYANGRGMFIRGADVVINSYVSGIEYEGSFLVDNSNLTINHLQALSAPLFVGINTENEPDNNEVSCDFNNSNINIVDIGYPSEESFPTGEVSGFYALKISHKAIFTNCCVNFDMSKSGGYAIGESLDPDNKTSASIIKFTDCYVDLIGGVELIYGNLEFYNNTNFYVTADNHKPLNVLRPTYESKLIVKLVDTGTGLFEYSGNDNKETWNYGFVPDGFTKAYASAVEDKPWNNTENYMEDYSSNYRWVSFRRECEVYFDGHLELTGKKASFTKFDTFPLVASTLERKFVGWFYTNSKQKDVCFDHDDYVREDMKLYPRFEGDEPVVTSLYPVELRVPTLTQNGVMPYYHDGEQHYFKDPEGKDPIGGPDELEAWKLDEGCIKSLAKENEIHSFMITPSEEIVTPVNENIIYFTSNADYEDFAGVVFLDDVLVPLDNYASFEGSTVINFADDVINDLQTGEHTIRIVSKDGFAYGYFFVNCKASDVPLTYCEGESVTLTTNGTLPYYIDNYTGKYYSDPNRENEIDFEVWKNGEGCVKSLSETNNIYTASSTQTIKTPASSSLYQFKSSAPFEKFANLVYVDGVKVDPSYYTAEDGSTGISFKEESTAIKIKDTFLNKLDSGEHSFYILSTDGHARGTFKIEKTQNNNNDDHHHSDSSYKVPKTGVK